LFLQRKAKVDSKKKMRDVLPSGGTREKN
jgi:hypothetical protein